MSTATEIDEIVQAAHRAYEHATAARPSDRAGWLGAVADALDGEEGSLVRLAQAETHLAEGRLRTELRRTTFQLRLFADELVGGEHLDATIDHADESWGMGPRPDVRRVNVPLGVVAVFGASNFPFAFSVMGGDSASALAAGCGVVHKVHDAHPELGRRTAEVVVQALADAGAPNGLFATVVDQADGEALVDHPLVKAVAFTGSTRVGGILRDRVARRDEPIPFYGELGSINPVFVTEQAWSARSAEILTEYVGSVTLGMGQLCTKPGLIFTPTLDDETADVVRQSAGRVQPTPMLTPRLAEGFHDVLSDMTVRPGLSVLVSGESGEAPGPSVLTTTAEQVRTDPEILRQEMFGPASIVVQYASEDELIEAVALIEGQLTASVHSEPGEDPSRLLRAIEPRTGRVIWNGWPTGVTVTYAQQHGGPYPATTASTTTSVGTAAVGRFMRPVAYQNFPNDQLPPPLQENNPWGIRRRVDGTHVLAAGRAGS